MKEGSPSLPEPYDDIGRLKTETDPLANVRTYNYDIAGRLTSRVDPKSQQIDYTYNDRNELTRIDYPGTDYVSFAYNDAGARTQMVDSTGTTTYAYDDLYRLTSVTFPGSRTVSYGYDDVGRRTSITYPGGSNQVTYGYDNANRLTSVTDWNSNTTTYSYDDAGRMTTATLPSGTGIVSSYTYDSADRLTEIEHVKNGSTTVASVAYTLDDVGNRTQRVDQQGTHTYAYDDLHRLTSVTYPGPSTTTYEFDAFGNRTEMVNGTGTTTFAYDDADRLTTVTPPSPASAVSYTWDNNGNLTDRGSDEFLWDYEDRMVEATVNSVTTTFAYRGDGLRDSRTVGMTTTTFTWDIASGLPVVLDDGNQYVYGAGLVSMKQSGNWFYYLADGLGSTMAVVDSTGVVQKSYQYDVYGEVIGGSGTLANEFGFAGQQTDATGLQYLRARYYDPATGVFLSREPLAAIPRWTGHPSAYASGNPSTALDPSGRKTCWGDGPDDCEAEPSLPNAAPPYCGPWGCVGATGAAPAGTPTPGAPEGPSACTLTPPINCATPGDDSHALGEWVAFAWGKLTGEYRSTALSVIDVFPLAEACGLALLGTTGPGAVVGIPACAALDVYIGGLAAIESGNAIEGSNCSRTRKNLAHAANLFNLLAEPSTEAELAAFAFQTVAITGC